MTKNITPFANYLRELRAKQHFSQEYVASKLNITRQTYSHYETGRINPPVKSLLLLAGLYQIPVENLITLERDGTVGENRKKEGNGQTDRNQFLILSRQEEQLLEYYGGLDEHDKSLLFSFLKTAYENGRGE